MDCGYQKYLEICFRDTLSESFFLKKGIKVMEPLRNKHGKKLLPFTHLHTLTDSSMSNRSVNRSSWGFSEEAFKIERLLGSEGFLLVRNGFVITPLEAFSNFCTHPSLAVCVCALWWLTDQNASSNLRGSSFISSDRSSLHYEILPYHSA